MRRRSPVNALKARESSRSAGLPIIGSIPDLTSEGGTVVVDGIANHSAVRCQPENSPA